MPAPRYVSSFTILRRPSGCGRRFIPQILSRRADGQSRRLTGRGVVPWRASCEQPARGEARLRRNRRLTTAILSTDANACGPTALRCPRQETGPLPMGCVLCVSACPTLVADSTKASGGPSERPDKIGGKLRALIVEDEPADAELVLRALQQAGFEASADVARTAEEFTDLMRRNPYDVILADYKLPNWNGMESVEVLRREGLDVPVIVVSGAVGELTAVECIKQGAADYVLKDHLAHLPEKVRRAMQDKRLRGEHKRTLGELARSNQ